MTVLTVEPEAEPTISTPAARSLASLLGTIGEITIANFIDQQVLLEVTVAEVDRTAMEEHGIDVEELIMELPTVSQVEVMAEQEGLENISSWTSIEEFDYESGEEFLNSPLITDFLLREWLRELPEAAQDKVSAEIARIIDEERQDMDFALSVKATLIIGRKAS